jgi:hypothetical protein
MTAFSETSYTTKLKCVFQARVEKGKVVAINSDCTT